MEEQPESFTDTWVRNIRYGTLFDAALRCRNPNSPYYNPVVAEALERMAEECKE